MQKRRWPVIEQRLTVAENNYNLALLALSQVLQVPFEGFAVKQITLDTPSELFLYNDVNSILRHALKNRSEIKVAEKNIEAAELGKSISRSGFYPNHQH